MKLKSFDKIFSNKKLSPKAMITLMIIVVGLIGIVIYQSYALYKLTEKHNIVNGEVGIFTTADIKLSIYVDGDKVDAIPAKADGKAFEKLVCTNSGKASWDNSNWTLTINNIINPTYCNAYFVDESKTLGYKIIAQEIDAEAIRAKGSPDMSVVPTALTSGIYATEDEYGTSYYYRGERGSLANNVIFAEHQWKVVRINGDGSIRLIYNGECPNNTCTINTTGTATRATTGEWNTTNKNDNKYVGYMYGGVNGDASTSKEQAQTNETETKVKTELDTWYESNIKNPEYDQYIADSMFCNDRSLTSGPGYGGQATYTYYKSFTRLYTNRDNPTPTLLCEQKNDRFTVSDTKLGNGALTYPIGLVTADEIQFGGIGHTQYNSSQYLYTGQNYWTFSPGYWSGSDAYLWFVGSGGALANNSVTSSFGLRVVINLNIGTIVSSGDGTASSPYIITTS